MLLCPSRAACRLTVGARARPAPFSSRAPWSTVSQAAPALFFLGCLSLCRGVDPSVWPPSQLPHLLVGSGAAAPCHRSSCGRPASPVGGKQTGGRHQEAAVSIRTWPPEGGGEGWEERTSPRRLSANCPSALDCASSVVLTHASDHCTSFPWTSRKT